jgi:hypothetical protein
MAESLAEVKTLTPDCSRHPLLVKRAEHCPMGEYGMASRAGPGPARAGGSDAHGT